MGKYKVNAHTGKPDLAGITEAEADARYEPILPDTPENPETKFLNGNREWAPIAIGAGGFAGNLYFTTLDSDVSGYKKISYDNEISETELSGTLTNEELLLRTYLFDYEIATDVIDAGVWVANYRTKVSGTPGITQLKMEIFLYHSDTTESTLWSSYSPELNNTGYETIRSESNQPAFSCDPTDRLGVRIYAKTTHASAITVYTIVGDGNASYFTTPLRIRHNQLRDLNGDTAYQHIDATDRENLDNLSGTNTGDQTLPSKRQITAVFDGVGLTPSAGDLVYVRVPYSGTITGWTIAGDVSGSAVVDVWKDTYANYPPTVTDTIAGSEKPTLSSAIKNEDTSLTTWTTSVTAGDWIAFKVDSASTLTKIFVALHITAST